MTYEQPEFALSIVTAASFAASQYRFAKLDSSGKVIVGTAGASSIGVVQNKPISGEVAEIVTAGVTKVVAGGAIAAGASITSDSTGRAVTVGGSDSISGYALTAAQGAGELIPVLLAVTGKSATGTKGSVVTIPCNLASVTAAGDVVTNWVPGFAGTIIKFAFVVTVPVTTGSKLASFNLEIGTTNLTGGVIAATSANCTPLGAKLDSTTITGANAFTDTDSISIESSAVTAFSEGAGVFLITLI